MKMNTITLFVLVFASFFGTSVLAQQTPGNLRHLIDERASFAENDMKNLGYVNTGGSSSSNGVYTYWWNQNQNECVCVRTTDGRYASITSTSAIDCNHDVHVSGDKKNTGAAVAVGAAAAAIIGAAILSNKSHHHKDNQHYNDHNTEAAFEQGYRDGLYNKPYHNSFKGNDQTRAYSDGYEAGVDQNHSETTHHSNHGGYREHFNINHLRGENVDNVNAELKRNGFRMTDTNDVADGQYMEWWYQQQTRQCYMLEYNFGTLKRITSVQSCY